MRRKIFFPVIPVLLAILFHLSCSKSEDLPGKETINDTAICNKVIYDTVVYDSLVIVYRDSVVYDTIKIYPEESELTIFFVNDQHGQLYNFARIKHIVDAERSENPNVLLVCAGDVFSGNPIVDQYKEKGYPMIDVMNRSGFDVVAIGNHEFDYGIGVLEERMTQSLFGWICANVDVLESGMPQPEPYKTIKTRDFKVAVLGLVETYGKPGDVIPSTHPWRVKDLRFFQFQDIVPKYTNLKEQEGADVYLALSHLGTKGDKALANDYPCFDFIIGGHSHVILNEEVNGVPVLQAGSYLHKLGKIEITVKNKSVTDYTVDLIELDSYKEVDATLKGIIDDYYNAPEFEEVLGSSSSNLSGGEVGCFYTNALKEYMQVDFSIQNTGGIRAGIDKGDITRMEIYKVDPFNNGSVKFSVTVKEIKDFFKETGDAFYVAGITLEKSGNDLIIFDEDGKELTDDVTLKLGMNDYIPAVYEEYFPLDKAEIMDKTTAESIIGYLKTINSTIDYEGCSNYFKYSSF